METREGLKQRVVIGAAPPPPLPEAAPPPPEPPTGPESRGAAYMGMLMAGFVTFSFCYYQATKEKKVLSETLWSPDQIALYNGADRTKGLLLSITGSVFDVTSGAQHYGKGKSYNHFCGRDASRAFVSGNFKGDGLTDDVSKLTNEQLKSLEGWLEFYKKTYPLVGKLVGRFYESDGRPTKTLISLHRRFKRAREELAKLQAEDDKHKSCNSKWTQDEGGEVWCESGYPRKVFRAGSPTQGEGVKLRCACFEESELAHPHLQEYPHCDPFAKRCKT